MRNKLTSDMRQQKCQRRGVLAALILATATPSMAADPSGSLRIVSPLPLTANAPTNQVQDNPFCEPLLIPLSNPMVRLASDRQVAPIRMKPIGVAVGLRNIGEPDAPPSPTILVTPPAESPIQVNPMFGSSHDQQAPLNEVLVTESAAAVASKSEAVSVEMATPFVPPPADTIASKPLQEIGVEESDSNDEQADEQAPDSLSDSMSEIGKEEAAKSETDTVSSPSAPTGIVPEAIAGPTVASKEQGSVVAIAEPLVPINFASESLPSLERAPGDKRASVTVKSSSSGVMASLVSNANRYRPPVAVSSPSIPLVRNESTEGISLVRPAVTRVESLHLDDALLTLADSYHSANSSRVGQASAAIDLHMNKTQVRTLTIGGTFRRITLADQAICQAIHSGASELKLIGTGCGVTELTIWADTGRDKEPKVRVFRIHVQEAVDSQGEAVSDKAETLKQSIARAYPTCRVELREESGQLVVAGDCDSAKSASGILKMVRKTCLIPVVDELRIR